MSAIIGDFQEKMAGVTGELDKLGSKMQAAGATMTRNVTLPILALGGAAGPDRDGGSTRRLRLAARRRARGAGPGPAPDTYSSTARRRSSR